MGATPPDPRSGLSTRRAAGLIGPAIVVIAKVVASARVLRSGFRAVSDDDFARVVIAEQWARAPRWDASGTSWLPFPFWITGAAMKIGGRELETARAVAVALGVLAALLVYLAARWLGESRAVATGGAVVAAIFPWSARLGVATVPELLTAALTVLAMAALAPASSDRPGRLVLGGAALLAATLSRYEAWPVALVFAGVCVVRTVRARPASPTSPAAGIGAAALALLGPVAWMAWNRASHGDALHFLVRVAAYRQALGGAEGSAAGRLWEYPAAMAREEPEILVFLGMTAVLTAVSVEGPALRTRLAPYAWPAALAAAQIAALSLAMVKDGAPTHHPERAVLSGLLLVALAGGALATRMVMDPVTLANAGFRPVKILALLVVTAVASTSFRPPVPREGFVHRDHEEAIGRAAASLARPGEPVLIEVADYGYLAVEAALGRPEDAVRDRSTDPRDPATPSSFADPKALRRRLAGSGARWVVARNVNPAYAVLGSPVAEHGAWGVFRAEARP